MDTLSSARVRPALYVAVAILCALAIALAHGGRIAENLFAMHWEDRGFFSYNLANIHSLQDCFLKRGLWEGVYRPLTTNLYYFLGHRWFNDRIQLYHVVNLVFLLLNALLLFRLSAIFLGENWGFVPPIVFASRLATVEVALHSCEFQGLLCAFFSLLTIDLFIRGRLLDRNWMIWCSILSLLLALLSKETAAMVPGILIVFGWLYDSRARKWLYAQPVVVVGLWAIAFRVLTRNSHPSGFRFDLSVPNILRNYVGYLFDFWNYLLIPIDDRMPPRVRMLADFPPAQILVGLAIVGEIVAGFVPRVRRANWVRIAVFGFAWFLIAIFPTAAFDDRLFMRYSYFGHAGLAICTGAVLRELAAFALRRDAMFMKQARAAVSGT